MKYFLRIIVNKDFQFDSEVIDQNEYEFEKGMADLRHLCEKGKDFKMKTNDGKTLIFGEATLKNSIFLIIPVDYEVKP